MIGCRAHPSFRFDRDCARPVAILRAVRRRGGVRAQARRIGSLLDPMGSDGRMRVDTFPARPRLDLGQPARGHAAEGRCNVLHVLPPE